MYTNLALDLDRSRPIQRGRSQQGCLTCRDRRVKCDEERPRCRRCARADRFCDYSERRRKRPERRPRLPSPTIPVASAPSTADGFHGPSPTVSDVGPSPTILVAAIPSTADGFYEPELTIPDVGPSPTVPVVSAPSRAGGFHQPSPTVPDVASTQVEGARATARERVPSASSTSSKSREDGPSFSQGSLAPDCARILFLSDHEVIHHFMSTISTEVDTRVLEHSGPAIIWTMARRNPLILHMVCALGGQGLSCNPSLSPSQAHVYRTEARQHYGSALALMEQATDRPIQGSDLDGIIAALWLMTSYEQRFGNGCGVGLKAQFHGAAVFLQEQLQCIRDAIDTDLSHASPDSSLTFGSLSPLSARIICWISIADGGAAFHISGGEYNISLGHAPFGHDQHAVSSRLRAFVALYRYSNLVYKDIWGASYPQEEMLEDLSTGPLLHLQAETGQLRYLLSQIPLGGTGTGPILQVGRAIQDVRNRYSEYLQVACLLELPEDKAQKRFVINIRCIAPFFLAVVLCYNRIVNTSGTPNSEQNKAVRDIMEMAGKTLKDEGEESMTRLAWPLFVAALESGDAAHRSWILERYDCLQRKGENYRRAREALRFAFEEQRLRERSIGAAELLRRGGVDKFVI
ncbi:hypothetical protein ACJ41O_007285 [Fusarium nematophilum]